MILSILKSLLCLFSLIIFLIASLISHLFISVIRPSFRWRYFSHLNRIFAKSLSYISGVRIIVKGRTNLPQTPGILIISNHLTYLDGVVIGSILPVIYLSKKAVKNWPLIGWMTTISGTIFIDRKKKEDSPKYIEEIAKKLNSSVNVLLFPEGTSTNGENIRDFQSVLFGAPLIYKSSILPITIQYIKINGVPLSNLNRDQICWYGQTSFYKHLWQLLQKRKIEVIVNILPAIDTNRFENSSLGRKELSKYAFDVINREYSSSFQ